MSLPPGYAQLQGETYPSNSVCRLRKSLYGLKQASRQWNQKLTLVLLNAAYTHCKSDHSMFVKRRGTSIVVILIYVDDILVTGNDVTLFSELKEVLQAEFQIKDLGEMKYFLGIEVARSQMGIQICQRKYTLEMLEEFGLLGCKPAASPMEAKLKLSQDAGELLADPTSYRKLIGKLIYLSVTRPDISFPVTKLSQYMAQPRDTHFQAALRVLKYLKNAPGQGLYYSSQNDLSLTAYSDADWGACPDSRKSVTGFCVFLGNSLVSWKSKKQSTVSRSSAESEYRALAQTTCELLWISSLLSDIQVPLLNPITLFCDSKSAIHIATNPVYHERTKHIEMDCHFVRDKVKSGFLQLSHVSSSEQIADLLTKPLYIDHFHRLLIKMGIRNLYSPS
ncbi:PREDICTED: uncharacterized protein LOC109116512 [Tarenaya hassleriana]|uniref:uncharacterized protein LOC109116512 n=1 Tax=Tarenaya hassleriana TaxID=28532 RepID=UPI0008FD027A|nr:PREDICTED: uncharacterized protein LOC109116512 [Tarenaya hassleriana]